MTPRTMRMTRRTGAFAVRAMSMTCRMVLMARQHLVISEWRVRMAGLAVRRVLRSVPMEGGSITMAGQGVAMAARRGARTDRV